MSSRTSGRTALLAAALAAAALPLRGAEARFLSPEEGATLAAGQSAHVTWTTGGTPSRSSEMELVLSLDGGVTFPIRITKDLAPDTRSLVLTVPSLPARHARLALRAGDGGEPGEEEILFLSDEFSIGADAGQPLEPALFVRGEWRTREALAERGSPALPEPVTFGESSPIVHAAAAAVPACTPRPRSLAGPMPIHAPSSLEAAPTATAETPASPLSRAPADAPRRE